MSEAERRDVRDSVIQGKYELWNVNGDTWIATEILEWGALWIWVLEGKDSLNAIRHFGRIARNNGIKVLGFFTFHRGARRVYGKLKPEVTLTETKGELRFLFKTENL